MTRMERIAEYSDELLSAIVSCPSCQPWEGGPVWVIGRRTSLDEVMDDCGVPDDDEHLREEILST